LKSEAKIRELAQERDQLKVKLGGCIYKLDAAYRDLATEKDRSERLESLVKILQQQLEERGDELVRMRSECVLCRDGDPDIQDGPEVSE
jgi:DNA repair exonuclease SbcCD ATPase subunit